MTLWKQGERLCLFIHSSNGRTRSQKINYSELFTLINRIKKILLKNKSQVSNTLQTAPHPLPQNQMNAFFLHYTVMQLIKLINNFFIKIILSNSFAKQTHPEGVTYN